jgi:peroxiredoxin (alkyl hydroperoxide reductase subunit C)
MVDPEGTIRAILYYPAELGRNFDEFLRMIRGFQVADEQDVAIPANWPTNELIGNRVIVPPTKDVETAKKRLEEFECYDWWLCHKPLEE